MPCSMRIELASSPEGPELLDFLRGRGLDGEIVAADERLVALEVGYARGEAERLQSDVWSALRTWLAERDSPLVPAAVGEDLCVLRPPGE